MRDRPFAGGTSASPGVHRARHINVKSAGTTAGGRRPAVLAGRPSLPIVHHNRPNYL